MNEHFFGGPFINSRPAFASLGIILLVVLMSICSVLFEFSSLLMLNPSLLITRKQWWRVFTTPLITTHPDAMYLLLYMLYIGRTYEEKVGVLEYLNLIFISYLFSILISVGLSFWPYFGDMYIVHASFTLGAASCVAAIVTNWNRWKSFALRRVPIMESTGPILVLFLAASNRLAIEALTYVIGGVLSGLLVVYRIPGFNWRCCCRGLRVNRRHATDVSNIPAETSDSPNLTNREV
ncbi:hypothetical protein GMRT_14283 [Giardia muris]|uniref:Peptidase S54 rhomboid domain-containing protein n=1 Tax=Giardia muris TaxID=5742 RepID=A0A4Z1SWS1_GIAMU|nr:hypothetical protein GMRT_14283 [Giardia muris]|eukprot:TNJ30176.1 hypothetical protein GMRT_14283 [Giardia muris]